MLPFNDIRSYKEIDIPIHFILYMDAGEIFISPMYARGILTLLYYINGLRRDTFPDQESIEHAEFHGDFSSWFVRTVVDRDFTKTLDTIKSVYELDQSLLESGKTISPERMDIMYRTYLQELAETFPYIAYGIFTKENPQGLIYALGNSLSGEDKNLIQEHINNIMNRVQPNPYIPFRYKFNVGYYSEGD